MLTTISGPFNASSELVTNATLPNPPGRIDILSKTTSSIETRWVEAPLMTGANFYYLLTYTSSQQSNNINTTNTSWNFSSLSSGTSYNISVTTVGELGFQSETVHVDMVMTRPLAVQELMAIPGETYITVNWKNPPHYKECYKYFLSWNQTKSQMQNFTVTQTVYNITDLDPGQCYGIEVTAETCDKTQGAPVMITGCTNASPVTILGCQGPNTKNAQIILSCSTPRGQYTGFQMTVNGNRITNNSCNYTISGLNHYTNYNVTVITLSYGNPSIPVYYKCLTGITDPPMPVNSGSLVQSIGVTHNSFILQIDSRMFNDSNGPIRNVGVLVSKNDAPSSWTQWLNNTYNNWKNGAPAYLATVVGRNIPQLRSEGALSIGIGNGSQWNGYSNGPLDANEKYSYAIVLFTNLTLQQSNLVEIHGSLLLVIESSSYTVKLPQDPAITSIAVGVSVAVFLILFSVLIGFIIYWKRLAKKKSPDIQIQSLRAKVSVAVSVEDFEAYYKKQRADSNCGFAEEFEDLKVVGTAQSKLHALNVENKPKNRYNNVLPYDSSRVKLSILHGSPSDDYINANYMPGYNSRKEFIAAQGPLPTTVNDFWRMIWEKNVQTLVMLTRCNEQGRVKCEQYWSSGTKRCDNIIVKATSEITLEDWTLRDFDIKNVKTAETRAVRQFHFTAWPDHGVPETTELLISFRHLVREHMNQYSRHSPTVVHCSAGVGRTGTFIAIDRLIFQIERENTVDVFGIVHDLRMHRPLMVQTEDQYVFLNQCALDIIRSRTGTNVDLIYQNTAAIYENISPKKGAPKNGYHNA
ncbi:receptor-type tyrosine-protein phosphatase eta [Neolamprologus brichardi]|uniref:receptor-type tyrosine-protein phosphatase eta n=1 Tax=Neolamprologus brichardi TaxID=32507 RepID=UPI001643E2EB|nr:receptor-type tyrosine-protein phosphatase eta [Neolamprologus brichardi]